MHENINGGTITYYLDADTSRFDQGVDSIGKSLDGAADKTTGFKDSATRAFSAAAEAALSFADNVVKSVGAAVEAVNSLGSSVQSTFEKISGVTLPQADMGYITDALSIGTEMASQMEGASMGIQLMTKDASRTEKIMNSVVDDAKKTTFNVSNLLAYTQQIGAAAGGDFESAEKAALAYGGAMVAAGNGLRDMGLVVRNIQQGMARGYNSIDLRQFKTYIPQFNQIMQTAGLTDEKIIEMGVDGAKAVNDAITAWVESEGIWEKYEYTYNNLKESLAESLQTTTMAAAQNSGLFESIRQAMIVIKNNLPVLEKGLTNAASTIAGIVNQIDWADFVQGVAAGVETIAAYLAKAAEVVMKVIKFVGGGDVGEGIKRLIPMLTTATIATKGLGKAFNLIGQFNWVFGGKGVGGAVEKFGGTIKQIGGMGGASGGKLGNLTQLAISLAAFAGALWLIQKALPGTGAEIAELTVKLGLIGTTMVAMELITRLATKIKIRQAQIKNLALMAGELALFGAALWVVDKTVPSDLGGISIKLGVIAAAIVGMGVIAGVLGMGAISDKVRSGLLTVAAIAGVLALTGIAIKVAYDSMPADFGGLQAKIGSLALVIVEIGVLAGIIGALMSTGAVALYVVAGLTTIIAIAGTLVLVGAALQSAYNSLPSDFVGMQVKIGGLALVITEIGALGIALGAAQILSFGTLTVGLFTLVEISSALAAAALGIKTAADNMPGDMSAVKERVNAGVNFLMEIKEEYGGSGGLLPAIGNFFWNGEGTQQFDTMVAISEKLGTVARNLSTIVSRMPPKEQLDSVIEQVRGAVVFLMNLKREYGDSGGLLPTIGKFVWNGDSTKQFDVVNDIAKKLAELADNLEKLSEVSTGKLSRVVNGNLFPVLHKAVSVLKHEFTGEGGLIVSIGNFFVNDNSTKALDTAVKISETLGKLVDNLAKIQDVKPGKIEIAIQTVIPVLKKVQEKLHQEFTEEGGFFKSFGSFFQNGEDTTALETSTKIAETLGNLVGHLAKIQELDIKKLEPLVKDSADENPLRKLKNVVTTIKQVFVDDADSVTNKLKEYDITGLGKAQQVAENIKGISDTLSGISNLNPNVPGINKFIESMKQIVSKIVEQFGNDSDLIGFPSEVATSIANVSSVVKDISEMNTNVNALKPVNAEEVIKRIQEIQKVIAKLLLVFTPWAENGSLDMTQFSDDLISSSVNQVNETLKGMKSIVDSANALPVPAEDIAKEGGKIDKIKEVVKKISSSFTNTAQVGDEAANVATAGALDFAPVVTVINDLKTIANSVKDFPDVGKGGETMQNFAKTLTETIKNLPTVMEVETLYTELLNLGKSLVGKISEGFKTGSEEAKGVFQQTAIGIVETLSYELKGGEAGEVWYITGRSIIEDLAIGITEAAWEGSLYNAGITVLDVLNNAIGAGLGDDEGGSGAPMTWLMIGQKIVQDIALGLETADFSYLYEAGNMILQVLNNAIGVGLGNDEAGSGAPMTWFLIGQQMIKDLANGLLSEQEILGVTADQLYLVLSDTFSSHDGFYIIGQDLIKDLANGMLTSEEILAITADQLYLTISDTFISHDGFFLIGQSIASEITNGILSGQTMLYATVTNLFNQVVGTLNQENKYNSLGNLLPIGLSSGINKSIHLVQSAMNVVNKIVTNITVSGAYQAGASIAQGLANGIMFNMWRINLAVGNLSQAAINTLKRLLDIHSPSKVMFELGEFTGEGLALGISASEKSVTKTLESVGNTIQDSAYSEYLGVGKLVGQGLAEGLNSVAEDVARSARNLANEISTELEVINPAEYSNTSSSHSGSSSETVNKTNNITLNNNIYNELDLSAAMSRLRWEMIKG